MYRGTTDDYAPAEGNEKSHPRTCTYLTEDSDGALDGETRGYSAYLNNFAIDYLQLLEILKNL